MESTARSRVLVIRQRLDLLGGGDGVCAWIMEALKRDYDLSLMTFKRPDFGAVDRFYGPALGDADIRVQTVLPFLAPSVGLPVLRRLRYWMLLHEARRAPNFDVRISVDEESDLGERGIQYINYPRLSH